MSTATLMRPVEYITDDLALPTFEVVEITPDLAQRWLGVNTDNRKLKTGQIDAFVRDITAGRWVLNGEAIKLAGSPEHPAKLLDGQNRLHAVLKAGISIVSLVAFNISVVSQKTMDSGAKRTVADNLRIEGTSHASDVAAAASLAIRFEDGYTTGYGSTVSTSRALDFIDEHPDLVRSATVAAQYTRRAGVSKSLITYSHWRFSHLDLEEATLFWRDMAEKVGLEAGDPVLALFNRFTQARATKERVSPGAAIGGIFRAWNARRMGKPLATVQFNAPLGELPRIK